MIDTTPNYRVGKHNTAEVESFPHPVFVAQPLGLFIIKPKCYRDVQQVEGHLNGQNLLALFGLLTH